jgi:hypothetical protein
MSFNPESLTPTVYEVYKLGQGFWILTVSCAIQANYRDAATLTNIAFYLHHPDLKGRALTADEKQLIAEWKAFHSKVKQMLSNFTNSPKTEVPKAYDPYERPHVGLVETTFKVEKGEL